MNTATTTPVSPVRPLVREGDHPIESTRYLLETPAVTLLLTLVKQWIRNRIPGAIIYGQPRRGKTKAILLVIAELAQAFPGMPVVFLPAFARTVPKDEAFMEKLLKESGHVVVESGDVEDKLERLVSFLAMQADASNQHRVVFIVDEAQMYKECHYNWLVGVHNELDRRGINLIVLLVGQHQLLERRTGYIAAGKNQIVGRFMVHHREFRGLTSAEEVKACLHEYDEVSEYPVGSGWSFTRYYLTDWFAEGGRLENLSDEFWSVICAARKAGQTQVDRDLGMQDFARTIDHFLRLAASVDPKTGRPCYDLGLPDRVQAAMYEALNLAGVISALKLDWTSKPKTTPKK